MRVLAAYGSKMGGTKGLSVGDRRDAGHVRRWAEEIDHELASLGS